MAGRTLPIYLAAGCTFAALAARSFIVPLRVHELGGDRVQIGLLFTVFTVTAALLSLPAGFLADRYGKKILIVFSVLAGGASQLGLAATGDIRLIFVWQALGGLCGGAAQASLFAALVDSAPRGRLGQAMGWLTLSMQVGFLSGPAAAGFSLGYMDLSSALALSSGLFGAALVLTLLGIRAAPGVDRGWDFVGPLRQIGRRHGFAALTIGLLGATVVWGTVQAFLPIFAKESLRLPETQIGYMLAIQAVANGLARIPGGRIVDRASRKGPIVMIGVTVFALAVATLPHLSGFWAPTALLALAVPPLAVSYIALGVVFSGLATEETRGVAMGLYGSVLFVGLGAGPAAFGPVMQHSGYAAGFTACAVTTIALMALMAAVRPEPLRRRARQPAIPPPAPGA